MLIAYYRSLKNEPHIFNYMRFTTLTSICLLMFFLMCSAFAKAQLGFCTGESGNAIFNEDFGSGTTNGPRLPAGVTNYTFVNSGIQDGEYTISSNMRQLGSFWNIGDRTGDTNGKMLLVNASFTSGIFYQTPITGLCENTPYEFSAWIINIYNPGSNACTGREIPIQVKFEIWDSTDTTLLSTGTMNPRTGDQSPVWVQYGLTFTTAPAQNGCILKLINQGEGGCGNDLAIDDIQFRPCGDATNVASSGSSTQTVCQSDLPVTVTLNTNTTTNVFTSPEYQWQMSTDSTNYSDIPGATTDSYTTDPLTQTTFYRVKLAEDAINLNNEQCVNFSNVFELQVAVVNAPTAIQNSYVSCDNEVVTIAVSGVAGIEVDWYDVTSGGAPLARNTNTFATAQSGLYYAQGRSMAGDCLSSSRILIEVIAASKPIIPLEQALICTGSTLELMVDFFPATYEWNTGETGQSIEIATVGTYECLVTTPQGCSTTAFYEVTAIEVPIIEDLMVTGELLDIKTTTGNVLFEYSLDGLSYQNSPVFNVGNLLEATVFVRNRNGCEVVTQSFFRIDIALFFTPNDDGFNDEWRIKGLANFPGASLEIFDRYGKLIKQINNPEVTGWDGRFNGAELPSSDYWYKLFYNEQIVTGHFTLKR
jgi:gliding motility-associated-like protein